MEEQKPKVGIGVIITKDSKVLFGKRKGSHGEGTWSFPGGHLEFGEDIFTCARREVMEETGVEITNLRNATFTNDIFEKEGKHYVTLFVVAEILSGVVEVKEPNKCEGWEWFSWDSLPEPLFVPIQNLLKQHFTPFA